MPQMAQYYLQNKKERVIELGRITELLGCAWDAAHWHSAICKTDEKKSRGQGKLGCWCTLLGAPILQITQYYLQQKGRKYSNCFAAGNKDVVQVLMTDICTLQKQIMHH